jgi:multidrug efflux system membrane fusion protein
MRRFIVVLLIVAVAGGGGWYWYTHRTSAAPAQTTGGRRGVNNPNTVVPVLAMAAKKQDVPIYLDGLGTAQASATVTVKAQVDGKLVEVAFTEGQEVKSGQVLARIDPRSYQAALDQASAKKAQDQATLANAKLDSARYGKLAANAYTSAQQADQARSMVAQLEAQVAGDQAQVDTARVNLGYANVIAPIDGRIGIRLVDVGNIVHASDTTGLCVITTLQPISVIFTLPQQSLRAVTASMATAPPEVLAMAQEATGEILDRGTLTVLDNQVDPATGTIKLKASFPNPRLRLWPGSFANVRLKVETRTDAIVVPPVAVQRGPTGTYAYVVKDDNTVMRRTVKVSHEDLQVAIISEGIAEGERVVTDGASRLSDGSKVLVADPAAPGAAPLPPRPRGRTGT